MKTNSYSDTKKTATGNELKTGLPSNVSGSKLYLSNLYLPVFLEICIPTYKRPEHLLEAINSIVNQVKNADVLLSIYDDSISNINDEVFHKSMKLPARIRFIRNDRNLGIDENINQCFSNAVGQYVLTIGEDDILMPDALKQLIDILQRESPEILYTSYVYLNNSKDSIISSPVNLKGVIAPADFVQKHLWAVGFIGSVVVNKIYLNRNKKTYLGTYFNHVGRVCINLNHETKIYSSEYAIVGNRSDDLSSTSWSKNYFDVLFGFESLIIMLSESEPFGSSYHAALKELRKRFGYLRFLNLCNMRGVGIFDMRVFDKYKNIRRGFVFDKLGRIVCLMPSWFFAPVVYIWPLLRFVKRRLLGLSKN